MSKKRADIQAISNELEGASLFFTKPTTAPLPTQLPRASKPEVIPTSSDSTPSEIKAKPERSDVRTDDGTFGRKVNRVQVRHAFDIYADQLRDLQTLQFKAMQRGRRKPTLGKMVQQAIDLYLERQAKRKKKEVKTERSDVQTDDGTFDQI